ncbi:MAG: hypothetical protein D6709_03260 [Chloroflexi bacterium]|uniref:Uncharacterized protein n=2 Tax=Candidatus Thermofonsia Clade 3 TaxID=2364209 RepID=A0A2M8QF20_9CHLR|nr:MAG: hypothetical protein CUN48_03510 [Candidatus Thermofonsia Clade 3 bacterium]RMG65206.1 MAG: hypothetical protein D6709_03260 [Chloroflexota bacterium]
MIGIAGRYNRGMWTLLVLLGIYAGTSALGTSIRLGWVSTRGWRWVHHALFALIWLALGGAAAWGFVFGAPWRWWLFIVAPFLMLLPRFRPGSSAHCWMATGGLAALAGLVVWAAVT